MIGADRNAGKARRQGKRTAPPGLQRVSVDERRGIDGATSEDIDEPVSTQRDG